VVPAKVKQLTISLVSFVAAGVVPALASGFIGLPTFRLRGPFFAIATIGVSEATRVIMNNLAITGGASGYRIMEHRPFRQFDHYYTALCMAALAVAASFLIVYSKFGMGCPVALSSNDRVKPDWVTVDGREEQHSEGNYYLDWYAGTKRKRE
jgi:ABC-type branched-subunit amino acid transport system permease subunit